MNSDIFVYGTLRKDVSNELAFLLSNSAVLLGEGTVRGRLYNLGDYPGLVLSASATDIVTGEVYRISPDLITKTLPVLDEYEGIGPSEPVPHEYRRELIQVEMRDGNILPAWAYILNRSSKNLQRIPSGDYTQWHRPNA